MFCCTLLYVHSCIAIILMGKRELIALLNLSSWCLVMVERLFLAVQRGCLRFVIVVFSDHTHYFLSPLCFLFWSGAIIHPSSSNYPYLEHIFIVPGCSVQVSNGAKIRNRYNQVPHLTQDTNGKVTNSQKTPQTRAKRPALSQQVTTKHI